MAGTMGVARNLPLRLIPLDDDWRYAEHLLCQANA